MSSSTLNGTESTAAYKIFRLLVPATDASPPNAPTIELEGTQWTTTDYTPMFEGDIPEYACVSYSWGSGKTANPLVSGGLMSDRVRSVTEATVRALHPAAIWIDAFCLPVREPERTACLLSMGAIYASAARVVAVLSKQCYPLLSDVAQMKCLDEPRLLLLENDPWVSRAWTYQEIVNSKSFCFTCEGSSVSLDGMQFLSEIMGAIGNYKKIRDCNSFILRSLLPRLDNLEDTIADWLTADFSKRSAYQVMSAMDRRTAETSDEYLNAMIGAISAEPLGNRIETTMHPAEYFMQLCEEKGDFSFIYSNAPRSKTAGRSWRPLAGRIPAIHPWHTYGDGQSGSLDLSCLRLHNMCRMTRGPVGSTAGQFITKWLQSIGVDSTSTNTPDHILWQLLHAGFAGCGDVIELENGYFFPLRRVSTKKVNDNFTVHVAAGVRWTHGGPGLIATQDVAGRSQFRDVGVFVGPVPKVGDSIELV